MDLVTVDVKSLFTVIPNDNGVEWVRFLMQEKGSWASSKTETTTTLLDIILSNNFFVFLRVRVIGKLVAWLWVNS